MARNPIDIVAEQKRKIDKERKRENYTPTPYEDAGMARWLCDPNNNGNNKSEWIRILAKAAAYIICEIETTQSIKGDGIIKPRS